MQYHVPVMPEEVVSALGQKPGARIIDCTVGDGGHAAALLAHLKGQATLLGIDLDSNALRTAEKRLAPWRHAVTLVQGNFHDVHTIAATAGWQTATGILLDLGLRSAELEESGFGFSFLRDEPLIMRYDGRTDEETAASLLASRSVSELTKILRAYGEEPYALPIAKPVVRERKRMRILGT